MGQASGELLICALTVQKNVDKNWNITVSFIIHVNFDHAWAKHYPVTLIGIYMHAKAPQYGTEVNTQDSKGTISPLCMVTLVR